MERSEHPEGRSPREAGAESNMIAELDHSSATGSGLAGSTVLRTQVWGMDLSESPQGAGGVGGLLAVSYQGQAYVPLQDGNGNVMSLQGLGGALEGKLVARYDYDPFGNRVTDTAPHLDTDLCPFGFSTKYTDSETGLLYYGFRYYNPELGRWLSRDPIGERGELNLYGFVGNDPVNRVDIMGLISYIPSNAPAFVVADAAGRQAIDVEHKKAMEARQNGKRYVMKEWGGRICCKNGKYFVTTKEGSDRRIFVQNSPPCPAGAEQVGWWHSHPGEMKAFFRKDDPFPFIPGGELSGTRGTGKRFQERGDTDVSDSTKMPVVVTRKTGDDSYQTSAYFNGAFYEYDPNYTTQ